MSADVAQRVRCCGCKRYLLPAEFDRNSTRSNGLQSMCRVCKTMRNAETQPWRRWFSRNPEKVIAIRIARQAISDGVIVKSSCEVCGSTENIEMHHDDYSKPTVVRFFCRDHHREFHAQRRRAATA